MKTLIIHSTTINLIRQLANEIGGNLQQYNTHFRLTTDNNPNLIKLREKYQIDVNFLPIDFNPENIKAFVSDMDSTLINIECIDEIADFAGFKPEVAAITEDAMQGRIDFNTSLKKRVNLLKGLNTSVLQKVYDTRLALNPGGKELIKSLQQKNILTAVVSGGFNFFTSRLRQQLNLDYDLANKLEEDNNILTGKTLGTIINGHEKAKFVQNLPFNKNEIITCGDGANDLEMMQNSGLSVAYHAKEKVNQNADIIIKFGGLDKIIDLF
jgi:phosphoserine phosphatase